ncbi:MAG TPA: S-methyl-5-thioribose-1-phosphate isomerase [Anaerolineaceae bacterium]|nr:S-methyl-5-thioribose-1-phosphate isomerase [Anaerolineaceae bacterium]
MLTLWWDDTTETVQMIDQRALPARLEILSCPDATAVAEAIRNMTVRGAPAIGVAAAYGLALAAWRSPATDPADLRTDIMQAAAMLRATRPTAVNLAWALDQMLRIADAPGLTVDKLRRRLLAEARRLAEEDIATNRRMAEFGAALIDDGDTIIHHCNTGSLAVVDYGTALGAIRRAHEQGKRIFVLVDETRPRLQGARLTAWELTQYGIPYAIIPDGASGHFLRRGEANKVFFGADRVAANGDVANKIGTYMLSLAAHANDVPVYAVMPASTIDLSLPDGSHIPIEERSADEVLNLTIHGEPIAPAGAAARNPAFDVTPHTLITALVTDRGVVYPPFHIHLPRLLNGTQSGSL